jgi:hypothetical protein
MKASFSSTPSIYFSIQLNNYEKNVGGSSSSLLLLYDYDLIYFVHHHLVLIHVEVHLFLVRQDLFAKPLNIYSFIIINNFFFSRNLYLDSFLVHEIVLTVANINVCILLDHVEMHYKYIDVDRPKIPN